MLCCLICNAGLVEAFQHLRYHYLVCRQCFLKAFHQYCTNAFGRVSLLGKLIPHSTVKLQKRLLRFKEKQQIQGESIFVIDIIELELASRLEVYDLSSEYSFEKEEESQIRSTFAFYEKYNWLKDKVWEHYEQMGKEPGTYSALSSTLKAVSDRKGRLMQKMDYLKQQLYHIKRQAPSLRELREIKVAGLLKNKYSKFFDASNSN